MDDKLARLANCFLAVFPELSSDEITKATSTNVPTWDSVAGVTLVAVIEEEFCINIEIDDLSKITSFQGLLNYLRELESSSNGSSDLCRSEAFPGV